MKVVDLKTMVVEDEPPCRSGRYTLFLELLTDEGISGLGERITGNTYSRNVGDLKSQISLIEKLGRQFVIGEDPFRIEKLWDRMYASRHGFRHLQSPEEANMGPLHKTIFKEPLVFENGFIIPPTGPGLGVEFDEDVLKQRLIE